VTEPDYNKHVVIVDDEIAILRSLERLLGDEGYDLHFFENANDALNHCRTQAVALVLSDVRMPGMDGVELMTLLAQEQALAERVLLTGYADINATVEAINKGRISYYLDKPWDDERLLRVVRKGVQNANMRLRNEYLEALTQSQNDELLRLNETLEAQVASRTERLRKSYLSATHTLSKLVDRRLQSDKHSGEDVSNLVLDIAKRLSFDEDKQQDLGLAAHLINIGKIGLQDDLLSQPQLDFGKEDRAQFTKHPSYAAASLAFAPPLANIALLLAQHKECINGSGYPKGLKADDINEGALILGIVSLYFEAVNGQYFSRASTHNEALEHLQSLADKHYPGDMMTTACLALNDWYENTQGQQEQCVDASHLREGMILRKDITAPNGVLVLAKHHVLDKGLIENLRQVEHNLGCTLSAYVSQDSEDGN
jgi:response regulator RpfG family c-di-GMP phosphodiesterase